MKEMDREFGAFRDPVTTMKLRRPAILDFPCDFR